MQVGYTESYMMEKLHYKSLRPGARHGRRKLWLVSMTKPWKVTGSWVSEARVSNPPGWKKKRKKKRMGYDCLRTSGQISHLHDSERPRQRRQRALPLSTLHVESQERCWWCKEGHVPRAAQALFCLTQRRTYSQGPCSECQWRVMTLKPWRGASRACPHVFEIKEIKTNKHTARGLVCWCLGLEQYFALDLYLQRGLGPFKCFST